MTTREISAVLEQVGVMTGAVQAILDVLGEEIYGGNPADSKVLYVDATGEPCFMDEEDAYDITDEFGDRIEYQRLGDSSYVAIYDSDERIVIDGDTYLLGNYIIAKAVEDMCTGVSEDELCALELEYNASLRPFVLGDQMVMAVLL